MSAFTDGFVASPGHIELLNAAMMGPNAMRISEEMASYLELEERMRVLDLGCGRGLSTLLLTRKYGVTVFAADLYVPATENYEWFQKLGIDDMAVPMLVDATKALPFAERYFDVLFSVDAYQYFGRTTDALASFARQVKKGGTIAVAVPGLKNELSSVPPQLQPTLPPGWDLLDEFRTLEWWRALWSKTDGVDLVDGREMACHAQAWDEWLNSSYAAEDVPMMQAEGGRYFNTIQLIAKVL